MKCALKDKMCDTIVFSNLNRIRRTIKECSYNGCFSLRENVDTC